MFYNNNNLHIHMYIKYAKRCIKMFKGKLKKTNTFDTFRTESALTLRQKNPITWLSDELQHFGNVETC